MTDQALSDVKVVEWGTFISAPFCTKLMADMGAEVIKVEPRPPAMSPAGMGLSPRTSLIMKKAACSFTSTPISMVLPLTRPSRRQRGFSQINQRCRRFRPELSL